MQSLFLLQATDSILKKRHLYALRCRYRRLIKPRTILYWNTLSESAFNSLLRRRARGHDPFHGKQYQVNESHTHRPLEKLLRRERRKTYRRNPTCLLALHTMAARACLQWGGITMERIHKNSSLHPTGGQVITTDCTRRTTDRTVHGPSSLLY